MSSTPPQDDFSDMDNLAGRLAAEQDVQAKRAALQGKVVRFNTVLNQAKPKAVKAAPDDFSDMDALVGNLQPKSNDWRVVEEGTPMTGQQSQQAREWNAGSDLPHTAQEAYRGSPLIGQQLQAPATGKSWSEDFKAAKAKRLQGQRPSVRMYLPGQSNEELRAAAASTPSALEESRREAANQAISHRLGIPLPRVATEALADITGGLASGVGSAVSGEAKPSVFNPLKSLALRLPGVQTALDSTVGRIGQSLQQQGQEASQVAGAGGIRGDVGRAVGGLAPVLAARNPLMVGGLSYTQARGRGEDEAHAALEGATSAAMVKGMGGAANVIGRAVPETGVVPALTRFGMRAAANTAIAPLAEAPGRLLQGQSPLPDQRSMANAAIMGAGFAAMPHAVEPVKRGLSPREAYEQQRAAEERATPLYPPVKPTEQGVETAIEQGISARQPLQSPRLIKRTVENRKINQSELNSASQHAPISFDEFVQQRTQQTPTPTGETGLDEIDARKRAGDIRNTLADVGAQTVDRPIEQPEPSTRTVAPVFTPGDVIKAAKGGTNWRIEASEGDSLRVRPLNRAGNPSGRARLLAQSDLQGFGKVEVSPQTVKPLTPANRSVKPESDTLLSAVQKIGFDSSTPEGADLARYLGTREGGRPGMVNKQRLPNGEKRGVDNLVRELQGHGFDVTDADDLLEKVRREQRGNPVYSTAYDHGAHAERQLAALADTHAPDTDTRSERERMSAFLYDPDLHDSVARLGSGEYNEADWQTVSDAARYQYGLPEDFITSIREEAESNREARSRESGNQRLSQLPVEAGEQKVSGAERPVSQQEGDVGDSETIRRSGISATRTEQPFVPSTDAEISNTADAYSRIAETLDQLKRQSAETGQSLSSLVEDRINQAALPGMEAHQLSAQDAGLLRQLAAKKQNRAPVKEKQQELLDTTPTVESKQARQVGTEARQAEGAGNAPLFKNAPTSEAIRQRALDDPSPWWMTKDEYVNALKKYAPEHTSEYANQHRDIVKQALADGYTVPLEVLKDYPNLVSHHSQTQPRDDGGKFTLEPPTPEPAKGEHGQFINSLFKSPDVDNQVPSFLANPEVRAKLGLPRTGKPAETKDALAKAMGLPRSSHISPEALRQWANENGLGQDALSAVDTAHAQYRAKLRAKELGGRDDDPEIITRYRNDLGKKSGDINGTLLSDPENGYKAVVVLGHDLYRFAKDFASWSRDMVSRLGERIRPLLRDLWNGLKGFSGNERGFVRFGKGQEHPFYSPLEELIDEKMPRRTTAEQLKGLVKSGGITADELKWSGFDEWLSGKKGPVGKDEALDFLKANRVEVKEVTKGETPELTAKRERLNELARLGGDRTPVEENEYSRLATTLGHAQQFGTATKFSTYTLPGGENYRELLMTLPELNKSEPLTALPEGYDVISDRNQSQGERYGITPPSQVHARPWAGRHATPEDARRVALEQLNRQRQQEASNAYKSSHFDEPNVLAHIRFNDRTDADGKRVLFLEEVQSDWHQAGRKKGYNGGERSQRLFDSARRLYTDIWRPYQLGKLSGADANKQFDELASSSGFTKEELQDEAAKRGDFTDTYVERGVPDAPFSGQGWKKLAMRRAIRYAAENGYDRVAWTTGEQQAERYDLSKQLDSIKVGKDESGYWFKANRKGYGDTDHYVTKEGLSESDLESNIGKDAANNALRLMQENDNLPSGRVKKSYITLRDDNLKIGGEGMKGFYDRELPNIANDIGKKWGARAGSIKIQGEPVLDEHGRMSYDKMPAHSLDITPAMRQSVMTEGQPMFGNEPAFIGKLKAGLLRTFPGERPPLPPGFKDSEGGFIRFGGTGSSKQADLADLFKTKDKVPVAEAHSVMHDAWDEFVSEGPKKPDRSDIPRAGEAYYEKAKQQDKLLSFRTLDSWMKANMLQGVSPYSHKVGSLASNAVAEAASTPGSAAADWVLSKGKAGRRAVVVDPRGMARAAATAATDGVKEAWQIMRQGATKKQIEEYGMPNQLNTRNPVVNAMVNYTFRAYKAGAHIFGTMAYQKALSNQAKVWALNEVTAGKIKGNEVSKRTQEILDGKDIPEGVTATMEGNATLAYADAVFQSDNKLNDVRKKIVGDKGGAWAFAVNRVVPFMKSASNAYLKMLDYTGVGPKGAAAESYRAISRKVKSGQAIRTLEDQGDLAKAWGKLPTGLALFAAGVALHRYGLMTSLTYQHDDNPQPGSVRAFGKLIDIARYSPIGLIMAAGATFDELNHDKGDDPLTAAVKTAGKGASNLPMFSQTSDLVKTAQALAEGKTSVPGVIGAVGKSLVTRTAPTMIPGYGTARDIKAGIQQSDKYVAGPLGKVLHVQNELKPPRSQAEVKAAATVKAHMPAMDEMTPEKRERYELKKQITDLAKKGDMDGAVKAFATGLKSGKLAEDDARDIDERTKLDYLQYQVKKLSAQDALSIYLDKRTTPEEREKIAEIIEDKLNKFDTAKHTQREIDSLMPQVMEFVKSRPAPQPQR